MIISKIIKIVLFGIVIFIFYKLGLFQKINDLFDKFMNNTKQYQKIQNDKKRFIRKIMKQRRLNDEV